MLPGNITALLLFSLTLKRCTFPCPALTGFLYRRAIFLDFRPSHRLNAFILKLHLFTLIKSTDRILQVNPPQHNGGADGVQIDPQLFHTFGIQSVPALVVQCERGFDVIRGNLHIEDGLRRIANDGDCAPVAQALLDKAVVAK